MDMRRFIIGRWGITDTNRPIDKKNPNYIYEILIVFNEDYEELHFPDGIVAKLRYEIKDNIISIKYKSGSVTSFRVIINDHENKMTFKYSNGYYEVLERL